MHMTEDPGLISVRAVSALTGLINNTLNAFLLLEYAGTVAPDGLPEVKLATDGMLKTKCAGAAETVQQSVSSQVDAAEHDIIGARVKGYTQLVIEAQSADLNPGTLFQAAGGGKVKPLTLDGTSDEADLIKAVAVLEEKAVHVDDTDIAGYVRLLI